MPYSIWFKEQGPEKPTTRSQRKIFDALAAKGYEATRIVWNPIGACLEMQGPEGGWEVVFDWPADKEPDYNNYWNHYVDSYLGGYNIADVLRAVDELPLLKQL